MNILSNASSAHPLDCCHWVGTADIAFMGSGGILRFVTFLHGAPVPLTAANNPGISIVQLFPVQRRTAGEATSIEFLTSRDKRCVDLQVSQDHSTRVL